MIEHAKRKACRELIHTIPCFYTHLHNVGVHGSKITPIKTPFDGGFAICRNWMLFSPAAKRENDSSILIPTALLQRFIQPGWKESSTSTVTWSSLHIKFATMRKMSSGRAEKKLNKQKNKKIFLTEEEQERWQNSHASRFCAVIWSELAWSLYRLWEGLLHVGHRFQSQICFPQTRNNTKPESKLQEGMEFFNMLPKHSEVKP